MINIRIKKRQPGAIVVIVDDRQRLLILKRPDLPIWARCKWALPGGKVEKGETPLEAAIRETKEETNLDVWDLTHIPKYSKSDVDFYVVGGYNGQVQIDEEHEDWRWVARHEITDYDLAPHVLELYDWVLENV